MTDHSLECIEAISAFLSQDKPLSFFPKGCEGWRKETWWLRDGTRREDLLSVSHGAVLPTCFLYQGAHVEEMAPLHHPALGLLSSQMQFLLPIWV